MFACVGPSFHLAFSTLYLYLPHWSKTVSITGSVFDSSSHPLNPTHCLVHCECSVNTQMNTIAQPGPESSCFYSVFLPKNALTCMLLNSNVSQARQIVFSSYRGEIKAPRYQVTWPRSPGSKGYSQKKKKKTLLNTQQEHNKYSLGRQEEKRKYQEGEERCDLDLKPIRWSDHLPGIIWQ